MRRAWITGLLQRKNAPKDAARVLGLALTRHATTRYNNGGVSVRSLLGIEESGWEPEVMGAWVEQHPTKGMHGALAVVIAGFENTADRNWWRYPDEHSRGYLTQLAAWGYPLSHVEQLAAGIQPATDQPDTDVADARPEHVPSGRPGVRGLRVGFAPAARGSAPRPPRRCSTELAPRRHRRAAPR